MGELEIKEILDMKFIDKETGEVVMTCPVMKVGVNRNLTMIEEDNLKEFMNYKPIVAEDDYWGKWNQDTVEWLLEPFSSGN